jgi:CheY-like chemotaxis protein
MTMSYVEEPTQTVDSGIRRLRHDLLNAVNVLLGTSSVLLETDLTELQETCVKACRNAAERLLDVAARLESYHEGSTVDGPAQLADLCSIAAARIDKPFEREELQRVIRRLAPVANPRVLLVDDAPEIEVLVRTFLRDRGVQLDVVADGERAVAQATSQQYDVVLMDIGLPGMDGATAAHAIRAADLARGARPTPIVALSAFGAALKPSVIDEDDDVVVVEDPEIAPLVPSFLHNRAGDVELMRQALERGEYASIQSLGHKMKGTGHSYGFSVVSRIGSELEVAAQGGDAATLTRLIDQLHGYLTRVRVQTPDATRELPPAD